jgi:polysaccharide export outer membrane protein
MLKWPLIVSMLLSLTSCGLVYVSPKVDDGDGPVRVVALNSESIIIANRTSYIPKQLPAVFFQSTGGSGNIRSTGATPRASVPQQIRPNALQLRVPPTTAHGPYRIGVGDVLLLATKSASSSIEELSGLLAAQNSRQGYTVQDDGAIAIPDVGRVRLLDMTLEEAEAELFQSLVQSQIDPTFSLEIAEFNSKRVSLGGAVGNPTVAPITLTPLSLAEALSAAGGIQTTDLEFTTIRIYRGGTLYQIPVETYLRQPELQKLRLVEGDSIFVDTQFELGKAQAYFQEQITIAGFRRTARTQALSELNTEITQRRASANEVRTNFQSRVDLDAVDRDFVYLTGEFTKPGRFTIPFGRDATLADALYAGGGFSSQTANTSQIYVLRGSESATGAVTAWHLNAQNVANITLATRMKVLPNDIVFIAEQPITKWNRALNQIFPTLISTGAAIGG